MEFFIKKNSTLPVLKVQIFKDTRNNFLQFDNGLSGATITFSMYDEINNVYKITDSPASLELVPDSNPPAFFVVYQFNKTQTKKSGSYIGEFKITQSTHESILPIREKLYINVTESFVDTDFCCRPNRGERIIIRPSQTPKPSFTPTPTNTPTRTLTPTPSFTPTATFGSVLIDLVGEYSSGSINANYIATSNIALDVDFEIFFVNILGTNTGSPITLSGSVIIESGSTRGISNYTISDNYSVLNNISTFSSLTTTYTGVTSDTFVVNTSSQFGVTPTPTASLTNTPTQTITPTSTTTNTPTPTNTQTSTPTPTNTNTNTNTPTNTNTQSSTNTPTTTETSTSTPTPTPTTTETSTPTPTNTNTNTNTPTPTLTPTEVIDVLVDPIITNNDEYIEVGNDVYLMFVDPIIPTPTPTPTPTNTSTPTPTTTETATPTPTPTNTQTLTNTETATPTPTPTNTQTTTSTSTPTNTRTSTLTPTNTLTATPSLSYVERCGVSGLWTAGNPNNAGLMQFAQDPLPFSAATNNMRINSVDLYGVDYSSSLSALTFGDTVKIESSVYPENYIIYELTESPSLLTPTTQWIFNNMIVKTSTVDSAAALYVFGSGATVTYYSNTFCTTPTPTPTSTSTPTPTNTPTPSPTIESFTTVGTTSWVAPAGVTSVEYLVVAGGGGGGNGYDNAGGGGGGAGMVLTGTLSVTPGNSYTVTVGDGGVGGADARANNAGSPGADSVFSSITSLGGGNGLGSRTGGVAGVTQVGDTTAPTGGSGSGGGFGGKGGGGASGNGSNNSGATGGDGGAGVSNSITGSAVIYGTGGAGANAGTQNPGVNGTSNTGNGGRAGGAGSANSTGGGKGGSGIVVLKYFV